MESPKYWKLELPGKSLLTNQVAFSTFAYSGPPAVQFLVLTFTNCSSGNDTSYGLSTAIPPIVYFQTIGMLLAGLFFSEADAAIFGIGETTMRHEAMFSLDTAYYHNSFPPNYLPNSHTSPEQVGEVAAAAGAKHVVLSHYAPPGLPDIPPPGRNLRGQERAPGSG